MPRIPPRDPPRTTGTTPTTPTTPAATPATGATPAPGTTSTPATPGGLDAATTAGATPGSGGAVLGGGNVIGGGGVNARLTALAGGTDGVSLFTVDQSRVPDAVGLPVVLKQLSQHPQSKQHMQQLLGLVQAETGITLSDAQVSAVLAKPERLLDVMQFTPKQMSEGLQALQTAHTAGAMDTWKTRQYALPNTVNLDKLASYDVPMPKDDTKEVAPGLLRGHPLSDLPADEVKSRTALAEVFDRLADNAENDAGDRFTVQYGGSEFTRLDTLLQALRDNGHEVTVHVDHRVANFSALMTKGPNGELLDVPAPVMVRTGKRSAAGDEAVLPSVHSELAISVSGPDVDTELKWYQGVPNTGFFPGGLHRRPNWIGGTRTDTFTGDEAAKAVELAGLFSDVIKTVAKDNNMQSSGYGVTGVCNDSVAVIQHALTGRATSYPLTMNDDTLLGELADRMSDRDRRDDPEYRMIKASIDALPTDAEPNATAHERALSSAAYKPGEAAFASTNRALEILSE